MDKRRVNLIGQTIGRLLVIGDSPVIPGEPTEWRCLCACGKETVYKTIYLRRGGDRSCGCILPNKKYKKDKAPSMTRFKEYHSYTSMRARCNNPSNIGYKDYGGRGIKVCDRWLESFYNFLADMGTKPSLKHTIDRIDVNGNYEPDNCRWSTKYEQCTNTRRTLRFEWKGKIRPFTEICLMESKKYHSLRHLLIVRGLPIADAVKKAETGTLYGKVELT